MATVSASGSGHRAASALLEDQHEVDLRAPGRGPRAPRATVMPEDSPTSAELSPTDRGRWPLSVSQAAASCLVRALVAEEHLANRLLEETPGLR